MHITDNRGKSDLYNEIHYMILYINKVFLGLRNRNSESKRKSLSFFLVFTVTLLGRMAGMTADLEINVVVPLLRLALQLQHEHYYYKHSLILDRGNGGEREQRKPGLLCPERKKNERKKSWKDEFGEAEDVSRMHTYQIIIMGLKHETCGTPKKTVTIITNGHYYEYYSG